MAKTLAFPTFDSGVEDAVLARCVGSGSFAAAGNFIGARDLCRVSGGWPVVVSLSVVVVVVPVSRSAPVSVSVSVVVRVSGVGVRGSGPGSPRRVGVGHNSGRREDQEAAGDDEHRHESRRKIRHESQRKKDQA